MEKFVCFEKPLVMFARIRYSKINEQTPGNVLISDYIYVYHVYSQSLKLYTAIETISFVATILRSIRTCRIFRNYSKNVNLLKYFTFSDNVHSKALALR